jgi:hypothetical protein
MLGSVPSVVPSTTMGTHCGNFGTAASNGWLRLGWPTFGGDAKLNAEVMSLTVWSRRAVRLGAAESSGTRERPEVVVE